MVLSGSLAGALVYRLNNWAESLERELTERDWFGVRVAMLIVLGRGAKAPSSVQGEDTHLPALSRM
jgi:hypothetical protein